MLNHMSTRLLVTKLLERLDKTDAYADILLTQELRGTQLSGQDKAFVQELFYGVVRWRGRLDWMIEQFFKGSFAKSPGFIKYILQVSFYQLAFMERIPPYAVINEAVKIAKKRGGAYWGAKINAILRNFTRSKSGIAWPNEKKSPAKNLAVRYSHPLWLVERWISQVGFEETEALCIADNQIPEISIRVNRLKTTREKLLQVLADVGIDAVPSDVDEHFFNVKHLPDLENFQPFRNGFFTIQDKSAGLPCRLLHPKPGEIIIDLCAAPGGKSTYLAELAEESATVVAVDRNFSRLNLVRQNVNRLRLNSVKLAQADGLNFACKSADKVLVDAPCSGLGVLAKRVDLRWKRTVEQINEMTEIQLDLLQNAALFVKTGGVIIYCTCTIEPDENERIIEKFLEMNTHFFVENASAFVSNEVTQSDGFVRTFPHRHGMDGSFAARLVKKSER